MIRREALAKAIEMAQMATDGCDMRRESPDRVKSIRGVGELWLGIADRLPIEEEIVPERPNLPAAEGDEETVLGMCGHGRPVVLHLGVWLHTDTLDYTSTCDEPPIKERKQ